MILPLVVLVVSAAVITAGIYLTVRGFKASEARAAAANGNGAEHDAAAEAQGVVRHDQAATEQLKRFFDGKSCAVCKRPIAPVQRTGLKPGLLDPDTHQMQSWDRIPNENLSAELETHLPICPACVLAESFRQQHPDLVVDREHVRHDGHTPDRVAARTT